MNAHVVIALIEAAIPVGGGLYMTLLAHRIVSKRPGVSPDYDAKMNKWGGTLQICGPLTVVCGMLIAVAKLVR
jgi:hypothetical protein